MKWIEWLTIPSYLVMGITDRGMSEVIDHEGNVEKDDLRIAIELAAGVNIVLDANSRIVVLTDALRIEVLHSCAGNE